MSIGRKDDARKPRMDLISPIALFALARLLTVGSYKYAARNWENGFAWCRAIGAILRHTFLYLLGETIDPETGESHMTAVQCEAMFLVHFEKTHPELDDRPKYNLTPEQRREIAAGVAEGFVSQYSNKGTEGAANDRRERA